ncbi:Hypothetical predicted protein [Octopus vulgaris]|uniref:Uncharacterized protein n=1 Tax=Octopus vulgaris TaxID=6645 RepID=A0AA36EZ97_OCTVU|nr:Hypothetical predicted protein [Octopus vulgaris]
MHNPYVKSFKQVIDIIKEFSAPGKCSTSDIITSHDKQLIPAGSHERAYNPLTAAEVAVIMVGDDTNNPNIKPADAVVPYRESNGKLDYIGQSYDRLHYVLLFPVGKMAGMCS